MKQLRFTPRPTLFFPGVRPEEVADLPLRFPRPTWAALPVALVQRGWFWCLLSTAALTIVVFLQDGFVVPSTIIVGALWLAVIAAAVIQYPSMRTDIDRCRIGIEIHESFLRIPYLLEQDLPWSEVRYFVDLDFNGQRNPCIKFQLNEKSYLRERMNPFLWFEADALYIGLPFGRKKRYVATALTAAAQQLGNAVEESETIRSAARMG